MREDVNLRFSDFVEETKTSINCISLWLCFCLMIRDCGRFFVSLLLLVDFIFFPPVFSFESKVKLTKEKHIHVVEGGR